MTTDFSPHVPNLVCRSDILDLCDIPGRGQVAHPSGRPHQPSLPLNDRLLQAVLRRGRGQVSQSYPSFQPEISIAWTAFPAYVMLLPWLPALWGAGAGFN